MPLVNSSKLQRIIIFHWFLGLIIIWVSTVFFNPYFSPSGATIVIMFVDNKILTISSSTKLDAITNKVRVGYGS